MGTVVQENVVRNVIEAVDKSSETFARVGNSGAKMFDAVDRAAAQSGTRAQEAATKYSALLEKLKAVGDPGGYRDLAERFKDSPRALDRISRYLDVIQRGGGKAADVLGRMGVETRKAGDEAKKSGGAYDDMIGQITGALSSLLAGGGGTMTALGGLFGGIAALIGMKIIEGVEQGLQQAKEKIVNAAMEQRTRAVQALETGLNVSQLEAMDYAAARLGGEIGNLNYGMRMLSDRIREQPEFFARLGIANRNARGEIAGTKDVLYDFADVLHEISRPTNRQNLITEVLGRTGLTLLPILAQGSKRLKEFEEHALATGYALTTGPRAALIQFGDAMVEWQMEMKALWNNLSASIAPFAELFIRAFALMIEWANRLVFGPLAKLIGGIYYAIAALGAVSYKQPQGFVFDSEKFKATLHELEAGSGKMDKMVEAALAKVKADKFTKDVDALVERLQRLGSVSEAELSKIKDRLNEGSVSAEELIKTFGSVEAAEKVVVEAMNDRAKRAVLGTGPLGFDPGQMKQVESAIASVENMGDKVRHGAEAVAQLRKEFEAWVNAATVKSLDKIEAGMEAIAGLQPRGVRNLTDEQRKAALDAQERLNKLMLTPLEQPKVMIPESAAGQVAWDDLLHKIRDVQKESSRFSTFWSNVWQRFGSEADQAITRFVGKFIQGSNFIAVAMRIAVEEGLRQLERLALSSLFQFLFSLIPGLGGPAAAVAGSMASGAGGSGAPGGGRFPGATGVAPVNVTNNTYVNAYDVKSIYDAKASPFGTLRRADDRIAEIRAF